jgi:4-hydroxy-4-methyl-2-oxoglutarate aldolase
MPVDLKKLTSYDTPTICNAIEVFNFRPRNAGFMDSRVRACFPEMPAIAGYASTATIRCAFPKRASSVYGSLEEQVQSFGELPGPAIVVFQDLDDPAVAATFGEVMCTTYKAFGAVGLITSGAARDLDQVRRLGFPAFSNGAICAHGYTHLTGVNCAVRVGGLEVYPGDLLHADANGITSIPLEIASEVPEVAAEYMKAESFVLDYLKTKNPDVKGFSQARQAMLDAIAALGKRVGAARVAAKSGTA